MDSKELRRRIEANPHNLPGISGAAPMSPHNIAAARFELEGRSAYLDGSNPYNTGTMAATRWQAGWDQADMEVRSLTA